MSHKLLEWSTAWMTINFKIVNLEIVFGEKLVACSFAHFDTQIRGKVPREKTQLREEKVGMVISENTTYLTKSQTPEGVCLRLPKIR